MTAVRFAATALLCTATFCTAQVLAQAEAPAQPATTAAPTTAASPEIDELIAQLSSPSETTRDLAKQKLLKLGEPARKALEAHIRARASAESLLQELDTNKIAGPTLITLKMTDVRPEAVMAEFAKQSGYEIQPGNDSMWQQGNLPNVSVAIDQQPFWAAFKQFCTDAGLVLYNSGSGSRAIQLAPSNQYGGSSLFKCPASANGAFLVLVTNLQRTNSVDLSNSQNIQRNMSMQMQVMAEPKVRIVRFSYNPELTEAVDDKGNSLLIAGRSYDGGMNMSSSRGLMWNVSSSLQYPANAGQKIAKLRGRMRVMAQVRSEKIEIPDVLTAKDVSKTLDGHRMTLKEVKKTSDRQYQLTIVFYRDSMDQQKFYEMVNNPTVRLLDSEGREFSFNGNYGGNSSGEQSEMKLGFSQGSPGGIIRRRIGDAGTPAPAGSEPAKLVWELATSTQEIFVPFEFTDLPLP